MQQLYTGILSKAIHKIALFMYFFEQLRL